MLKRRLPFLLALLIVPVTVIFAQEESSGNQAGLIIDHGDGQVDSYCVVFEEEQISGAELLQRVDVPLVFGNSGGMGTAVCAIDDTGCSIDDCFCQCAGGEECIYWAYWQLREGEWRYAAVGANTSKIRDGDVEGWVWGPGTVTQATPPLNTSIEQICTDFSPTAVSNPAPRNEGNKGSAGPQLSYIGFAALLVVMGSILFIVRRRMNG